MAAYDVRASLLVPPCFFVTNSFRRSYLSNDLYESHRKVNDGASFRLVAVAPITQLVVLFDLNP